MSTAAILILVAYILFFGLLALLITIADLPVYWGKYSRGAPMSRRSKFIFVATVWSSVGMIAGATLQHQPLAGLGASGFFFGVILCLISGAIDHWQAKRQP